MQGRLHPVAVSDPAEPTARLIARYAEGLFPIGLPAQPDRLLWVRAEPRAIIRLDAFHIPRRLQRSLSRNQPEIAWNEDFSLVVASTARPRDAGPVWITPALTHALHRLRSTGHALCLSARKDGRLIGGLWGIALGGAFIGGSMFSGLPNASKACLVRLAEGLKARSFRLIDCQTSSPHLRQFGMIELSEQDYRPEFRRALALPVMLPEGRSPSS